MPSFVSSGSSRRAERNQTFLSTQTVYETKFNPILSDHDRAMQNMNQGLLLVETALVDLEEADPDDEEHKDLKEKLHKGFCETLDQMYELNCRRQIIEKLKVKLVNGRSLAGNNDDGEDARDYSNEDFVEFVETTLSKEMDAYMARSEKERYHSVESYVEMRRKVWSISHTEPFRLDPDDEDDDELAIVSEQVSLTCPFTLALMEKPHTSKICKHSYSAAVLEYIRRAPNRTIECPVSGCNRVVRLQDLYEDKILERKIERHREAQEDMRAGIADMDDDEDEDEVE
ncbi:hypothetical protein HDU96_008579 [Phlyctochytrium bullatum]|nr:hypothetical protein HDU96_008579 [Phlyctochytrium bullatum]